MSGPGARDDKNLGQCHVAIRKEANLLVNVNENTPAIAILATNYTVHPKTKIVHRDTLEGADHAGVLQTGHGGVCVHPQPIAKTK